MDFKPGNDPLGGKGVWPGEPNQAWMTWLPHPDLDRTNQRGRITQLAGHDGDPSAEKGGI